MATSKIECLWQLLSTTDFKEDIPESFNCILCHNIAIEPFTALCECRFCSKCIKKYLQDGKKHCPGVKNYCAKQYLEIDVNITRDVKTIRSIGRINVKCPNEMCEVRCNLENMNDHLRVCGMSKTNCLYEKIGCQLRKISMDNVKTHYDNEWFFHTKLLVEAIDNLRNDVKELKTVVEKRNKEINKLKEDSEIKEKKIKKQKRKLEDTVNNVNIQRENMMTIINEMKEESTLRERQITSKIQELKRDEINHLLENLKIKEIKIAEQNKEIDALSNNVNEIKEKVEETKILISEIKQQADDQRRDTEELKIKDERRDREMEVMKETQQKTRMEELENVKRDIWERDVRRDFEDQRKSLNDLRVNQKNIEREINYVVIKVRDTRIFDEREFIWRLNDFSKMREDGRTRRVILWRYSLKLRLYLWCHGDYLGFDCSILKGELDNCLEWPMKHKITFSLINQVTMKSHKSVEYRRDSFGGDKSVFNKPKKEFGNGFIGEYNFMTIKEITDTQGLLLDDSFVASFNIDYN